MTEPEQISNAYVVTVISLRSRIIKALLVIAVPLISLGILSLFEQIKNHVPLENYVFSLLFLVPAVYFSWKALTTKVSKELTGEWVRPPVNPAVKSRVFIAGLLGTVASATLVGYQMSLDNSLGVSLAPVIPIVIILALYIVPQLRPSKEFVPSPSASIEKARLDAEKAEKSAAIGAKEAEIMAEWWFRYGAALVEVALAWWLHEHKPHLWFVSVFLIIIALYSAAEFTLLGLKLIGIGIVIGLIVLIFQGVAAMTVPVAIILGAIIIAFAISSKS